MPPQYRSRVRSHAMKDAVHVDQRTAPMIPARRCGEIERDPFHGLRRAIASDATECRPRRRARRQACVQGYSPTPRAAAVVEHDVDCGSQLEWLRCAVQQNPAFSEEALALAGDLQSAVQGLVVRSGVVVEWLDSPASELHDPEQKRREHRLNPQAEQRHAGDDDAHGARVVQRPKSTSVQAKTARPSNAEPARQARAPTCKPGLRRKQRTQAHQARAGGRNPSPTANTFANRP